MAKLELATRDTFTFGAPVEPAPASGSTRTGSEAESDTLEAPVKIAAPSEPATFATKGVKPTDPPTCSSGLCRRGSNSLMCTTGADGATLTVVVLCVFIFCTVHDAAIKKTLKAALSITLVEPSIFIRDNTHLDSAQQLCA